MPQQEVCWCRHFLSAATRAGMVSAPSPHLGSRMDFLVSGFCRWFLVCSLGLGFAQARHVFCGGAARKKARFVLALLGFAFSSLKVPGSFVMEPIGAP